MKLHLAYLHQHIDLIREMRAEGKTVPEIAGALKAKQHHVYDFCREMRIPSTYHGSFATGVSDTEAWGEAAKVSTKNLLKAIRRHHPERCAA